MEPKTPIADVRVEKSNAFDYINSRSIHVTVGEEADSKDFFIHEGLICPRSDFFKKAMNGPWQESDQRAVSLPTDEPDVFSLCLILLCTNKLPVIQAGCEEGASDEYYSLSRLFVLAEKLIETTTKSLVLAAMTACSQKSVSNHFLYYPAIDSIQTIYDGTPEGSPARELFVKLYTKHGDASFLTARSSIVPKDFLYELSVSILRTRPLLTDSTELERELLEKDEEYEELAESLNIIKDKWKDTEMDLEATHNKLRKVKAELETTTDALESAKLQPAL